jgi:BirA family transcriptional regulator, biotin operon repressor / biotin---[acetyl-CoA-carboxylase] ligase
VSPAPGSPERAPLGDLSALRAGDWNWPLPTVVETTASTMEEIEERASQGAPEGTVVVAEEQTAGRGRRGRTWVSAPRAGLWWSLLLRPAVPPSSTGWLPLVIGVGVARALRDTAGAEVGLKWPNDVLVRRSGEWCKLAGILAERLADGAIIVGVGVNVDHAVDELPEGGCSLRGLGLPVDRTLLLLSILRSTADAYRAWIAGVDPREAYVPWSVTLGEVVVVDIGHRSVTGRAVDLGPSGELVVDTLEGTREVLSAGDVTLLRPLD